MITRANIVACCIVLLWSSAIQAVPYFYPTTTDELPELNDENTKALVQNMGQWLNQLSEEDPNHPQFSDEHYKQSFLEMSGAIDYKLTAQIKAQIIYRTSKIRSATERTLGKSQMYFPIFEEYLAKKGMPRQIKYLTIVESNLNPVAKSHASAVGLWQFIPGTGKMYGLAINSQMDERSDTHKATDAATTMLSSLYERYGDWCLALAAYNCGPGRIDKLVKSKGYDYWKVRQYLPRETQMYVPFFMSVVYTFEYHAIHELKARPLERDLVITDTLHLPKGYKTLSSLATQYGVSQDLLKQLNPVYYKNYIPSSATNNILVLPARIVASHRGLAEQYNRILSIDTENPIKCIRRINKLEDLQLYQKAHQCTKEDILFWNRLPQDYVFQQGDMIAIRRYFAPKDMVYQATKTRKDIQDIRIHSLRVVGIDHEKEKALTAPVYVKTAPTQKSTGNIKIIAPRAAGVAPKATDSKFTESNTTNEKSSNLMDRVSKDRSRGRRLRGSASNSPAKNNNYQKAVAIPAAKATEQTAAPAVIDQQSLEQVESYGQQLQREAQVKLEVQQRNNTQALTVETLQKASQKMEEKRKAESSVKLPTRSRTRNLRD